jgi:hypothetical protein
MNLAAYTPITHEDYWTHDIPLCVGKFPYYRNEPRMIQGKIYVSEERFYHTLVSEIIPLSSKEGTRRYVHMKPYILEPQVFFTIGMYPKPKHYADQDEAIGEVLSSEVKGMRQNELGNAQAWYYPTDKTIVLWECFLESSFRTHPLTEDPHMRNLWSSFEKWLVKQFPEATTVATPFNDPVARTSEEYQTFLRSLDYKPIAEAAFGKLL